jgi:hypothetical protein
MESLCSIIPYFSFFYSCDILLNYTNLQGIYYLIHTFHNALIVYSTYNDVLISFTDLQNISSYPINYEATSLVFALHFYHIIRYWNKLNFEDWLHHITMIFIALPLAIALEAGPFLGFSLFFTTGLPGGINYFFLFLVRNGWMPRLTEKGINHTIQVWIRSPGCVGQAMISLAYIFSFDTSLWMKLFGSLSSLLVLWNGQYFMDRVVSNWAIENFVAKNDYLKTV